MKLLFLSIVVAALAASPAYSQKSIHTGGVDGAYNKTFCPPLPDVLAKANFPGYKCMPSGGTLDNIAKVLARPSDVGFVQLDVLAREMAAKPDLEKALTVIRSDIACEGLWMVTKNTSIKNFGDLLGARRTPYILPSPTSGTAGSFAYLQSIDPDGLGRAKNIKNVADATAVINAVAVASDNAVGFFVQFADPENPNIKLMMEKGLNVIPVISREISQAKIAGNDLYSVQEFNLTAGGLIASGKTSVSACTPVAVITGNPEGAKDRDAKDDQKDLIKTLRDVPSSALLPRDDRLASLLKSVKKLGAGALNEALAAVDKAKQAAEAMAK